MPRALHALFASAAFVLGSLLALPARADLNSEAQQMFNDLGAMGNIMYEASTYCTGGSGGEIVLGIAGGGSCAREPGR